MSVGRKDKACIDVEAWPEIKTLFQLRVNMIGIKSSISAQWPA